MFKDKVEPDASGVYWGDPQKVHLKEKCTGTVKALVKVYRAPTKVEAIKYKCRRSYQFNTIVSCKVQWAERRKTASVKTKTTVVDMFDVSSSQGTTPSPGIQRGRKLRAMTSAMRLANPRAAVNSAYECNVAFIFSNTHPLFSSN